MFSNHNAIKLEKEKNIPLKMNTYLKIKEITLLNNPQSKKENTMKL